MTSRIKAIICSVLTAQLLCSCNIQTVSDISEAQTFEIRQDEESELESPTNPEALPEVLPQEQDSVQEPDTKNFLGASWN